MKKTSKPKKLAVTEAAKMGKMSKGMMSKEMEKEMSKKMGKQS